MIEYARFTATPVFAYPPNKSNEIIQQHATELLNAYHLYHEHAKQNCEHRKAQQEILKEVFKTKRCHFCNGKMKYITMYDFWGCENYKQPGQHSNISGQKPEFYDIPAIIKSTWITDIIKDLNLFKKVTAKSLFEFYIGSGLEDLRAKYGYSPTTNILDSLNKTKRASIEQELKALTKLQSIFNKVVYQQCITYKMNDEAEKFCIPDFICGTPDAVYVVDAKLDYVNDEKMRKYISLVEFIIRQKNDKRPVNGGHIMYDSSYKSQSKYKVFSL